LEEVETHGDGDFENQVGIERMLIEDFVDMVAGARYLLGQPTYATLVSFQLSLYEMSNVDVALKVFHCLPIAWTLTLFPWSNEKA
jgi:hypothetical protein